MSKLTSIGTKLYMADGLPATADQAGYEALTWVEIGEVTDIPQYGPTTQVIESNPLKDGIVQKFPGSTNYGSADIGMDLDPADAGQIAIEAALPIAGVKNVKSFHVDYTGFSEYFSGSIFSNMRGAGGNSMVSSTSNIELDTAILRVV